MHADILGIESSCDETAAAVVEETGDAAGRGACARASSPPRSRFTASGAASFPRLASRQHIRDICGVLERALAEAGVTWTRSRRRGRHARARPRRLAARRRVGREVGRRVARRPAGRRSTTSRATSSRSSSTTVRCRFPPSSSSSRAVTPASISWPQEGEYRLHRPDARRRGGRGVRQGGEAAGARLSGRAGHRSPRAAAATIAPSSCRRSASPTRTARRIRRAASRRFREGVGAPRRLQLQRPRRRPCCAT